MSLLLSLHPPLIPNQKSHPKLLAPRLRRPVFYRTQKFLGVRSLARGRDRAPPAKSKWEGLLSTAASLYPLYVTVGGAVACVNPSAFTWFVARGPASYSCSLGFIMLAMGLTLELRDLFGIFRKRPFAILFGCVAQYTIMPAFGAIVSSTLGLPPFLSVTLIARGDVPLSILMTICTTLAAVILTPLLTKILAGTFVPVDALKLSISTLQVVVAPILLGSYMQSTFPAIVEVVAPFAPLLAVLASSLLASSVFSENVVRLKSSVVNASGGPDIGPLSGIQGIFSGDMGAAIICVLLLHFTGFFVGYLSAAICGFRERQRRAISIEVGMQNSSLGVVLATTHFSSPLVAIPAALSAVIMNIMGSTLGFIWRYIDPLDAGNGSEAE